MYIQLYNMASRRASKSTRTKRPGQAEGPVSLSLARARLSPLIESVASSGRLKVPISVRGVVKAYVVSARRLDELESKERAGRSHGRPPPIRGTLEIVKQPTRGEVGASARLEAQAVESWDRATLNQR